MNQSLLNLSATATTTISGTNFPFKGESVISTLCVSVKPDGTSEVTTHNRWAVCLYRDADETGQFLTADVIGLPGVASEGASREEAISNVKEAIRLRFEGEDEKEVMKELRHDYTIPVGGELIYVTP